MSVYRFLKVIYLLPLLAMLFSCHSEVPEDGRVVLAEVGTSRLYKDEMDLILAVNNYGADSARFVDEYLERWAMEELYYNQAKRNVISNEEIEKMVEGYRKNLVLNLYQEGLVNQHLRVGVNEKEISDFYASNTNLFDSDENLLKGMLVVLPAKAPQLNKVRRWCIDKSPEDLEALEGYCAENAVAYEYFRDTWRECEDVAKLLPITEGQLIDRLLKKSTIEFKEDGNIYFVCADTIVKKGETMPIELVSSEISELLLNSRKADFIKAKKRELYENAKIKGEIKIYK